MTFSSMYKDHAYADLILEAEKQGAELGSQIERERIIALLTPYTEHAGGCELGCYPEDCSAPTFESIIKLIEGTKNASL
jgi:hypothetical protein